jgi:uncharacterized phiE125 gp8 family phage protein
MSLLFTVVTPSATPAVSLADCKLDLRITTSDEDVLILSYIDAASRLASEIVGRKLINETIKYSISRSSGTVTLPFTPVTSVTEIQYFDADDISQTLTITDFHLYNFDEFTQLVPKAGIFWPTVFDRRDAINITFVAGYGAASADIPDSITKAIRLIVVDWFENRGNDLVGLSKTEITHGAQMLLNVERIGWVA